MNYVKYLWLLIIGLSVFSSFPALSDEAETMGQIEDYLNFCEHDIKHAAHFSGTDLIVDDFVFSQGSRPTVSYRIPVRSLEYSKYDGWIFFQCKTPGCVQTIYPGQLLFDPPTIERRTTLTLSICDIDSNAKVSVLINQLIEILN